MKRNPTEVKTKRKLSFWQVAAIAALIGIISYHLTGSTSISTLLILILLVFGTIKLLFFAFRAGSLLAKILVVALILFAWLGVFLDKAFK